MGIFVDRPSVHTPRRARVLSTLMFLIGISLLLRPLTLQGIAHAQPGVPAGLTAADWQSLQAMLPPRQQDYIKAANTDDNDNFGWSVAVDGDTAVIGAPYEDSSTTGVNSTPNEATSNAGAAYVFVRSGSAWTQQAYLKASNAHANDNFGWSVAVDGDTIVVGAPQESSSASHSGAAFVFARSGTGWSQQAYLKASNPGADDEFGGSVAISGDTVVVGAYREESAATGVGGNQNDNSASMAGAAYVFGRSDTTWTQQAYLKASNAQVHGRFGIAVAVDGDTIVVGAFGEASSTTGVNSTPNEEAGNAGAAYVFVRSGAQGAPAWTQQAYLKASNTGGGDQFGRSVAISGDTVVIGAPAEYSAATGVNGDGSDNSANGAGAAYAFVRNDTTWIQQAYLKAFNTGVGDSFGYSVAVEGNTIAVGAPQESSAATGFNGDGTDDSLLFAGAAYMFTRNGAAWTHQAYLKASNTGWNDDFGWSVGVSGDTVVAGAMWEDSAATGVNGNYDDDSAMDSGAAYIMTGAPLPTDTNKFFQYLPLLPVDRP
jgi:hypothetical protein